MTLNGDVDLPANATAKIGQTSLLGSLHVELAPPDRRTAGGQAAQRVADPAALGRRLSHHRADAGGDLAAAQRRRARPNPGHHAAFSTAFAGREHDLRSLIEQLDTFIALLNDQNDDIIAATDSLNNLAGQFADQKPVVDKALKTIPDALAVLKQQRDNLVRGAGPARQVQRAGRRLGQPDQGRLVRSSKTSPRCWIRSPTPDRR